MKNEQDVSEFGKYLFFAMVGHKDGYGGTEDGWEKIREEAEPLVRQLIAIEERVNGTQFINYKKSDGGIVYSKAARIRKAQEKLWKVDVEDLKEGDMIWFEGGDQECALGDYEPMKVDFVKDGCAYMDMGRAGIYKITPTMKWVTIFRAPADYKEKDVVTTKDGIEHYANEYDEESYWLKKADNLGI